MLPIAKKRVFPTGEDAAVAVYETHKPQKTGLGLQS